MPVKTITGTEHEDLVKRLLIAGWTSFSVAMYLKVRHGVNVSDSTVRYYRVRHREQLEKEAAEQGGLAHVENQTALGTLDEVDALGVLGKAIGLQWRRILKDVETEQQFPKGFDSTRHEMRVLAEMVERYHAMMQDYGLAPKIGVDVHVQHAIADAAAPLPLEEAFADDDLSRAIEYARMVNERAKELPAEAS